MPSLKFPDSGSRYIEMTDGRPAIGRRGYLYTDMTLSTPAEAYADVNGVKGSLLPTDINGRRYIDLNAYGKQPDYWGPESGADRLTLVVNDVAGIVDADYNSRIDALATLLTEAIGRIGSLEAFYGGPGAAFSIIPGSPNALTVNSAAYGIDYSPGVVTVDDTVPGVSLTTPNILTVTTA